MNIKETCIAFGTGIMLVIISSCSEKTLPARPYAFFVAGHSSGWEGLNPSFTAQFDLINAYPNMSFGVFTGDLVTGSNEHNWSFVDSDLKKLSVPYYIAAGNHDLENRGLFEERYGRTYYSFTSNQDHFIILDPTLDGWNISGDQLDFLKAELSKVTNPQSLVFVFMHQLIWLDGKDKYSHVRVNSHDRKAAQTNFWTDVEPLFRGLGNEVYLMAGDLGAGPWSDDFMYDQYNNITLIASGMGEGQGDNFIITNIDSLKKVSFELVCIESDTLDCFGDIKKYRITED